MLLSVRVWTLVLLLCAGARAQAQVPEERFEIVSGASDLHWLVYKAGAMARFGHNHTIAVRDLRGGAFVNRAHLEGSRFEMEFSVANLVIDDPALRSKLGEDFASVPSPQDIEGTRGNMLSERVLKGDEFPLIRISGTGPTLRGGQGSMAVTIELLGRKIALTVPGDVVIDGDTVRARGEFELNHSDLGMQPFSVMMGALQVGEKLSFVYDITARRATD